MGLRIEWMVSPDKPFGWTVSETKVQGKDGQFTAEGWTCGSDPRESRG